MLRVLVVDDDQDTATTFAMLLRVWGHGVEVAADGPSALQAVQASPPDVVLLDIAMPKMDGWEVARQIRQDHDAPRPLIVAISGYGDEAARRRSFESGIDLHLLKPVDPFQLEDVLKWSDFRMRAETVRRESRALLEWTKAAVVQSHQLRHKLPNTGTFALVRGEL